MSERKITMVCGDFRKIAWPRVLLLIYIYISAFWNNPNAAPSTWERSLWATQRDATSNVVTTAFSGGCLMDDTLSSRLVGCLRVLTGTAVTLMTIWVIRSCHTARLWYIVGQPVAAARIVRLAMAKRMVTVTGRRQFMAALVVVMMSLCRSDLVRGMEKHLLPLTISTALTSMATRSFMSKRITITTMLMVTWSRIVVPIERSDTIDPSKSINCSLSKRVEINEWSNWDISCRGIIVPNR